MDFKQEYSRQVDVLCNTANPISGEEMLRRIKEASGKEEKTGIRMKRTVKMTALIAACIAALSMTLTVAAGAAGIGPLADLFRELFHDETTAQIVEEGCVYEVGKTASDGIFQTNFIAVTGDEQTPKFLLDIYIHDEAVAAENDVIGVCMYTLGVQQYEQELDSYGTCDGLAYKDETIPNLYHASIVGAPAWVTTGEEFVTDVCMIVLDIDEQITEADRAASNEIGYSIYLYPKDMTIRNTHMEFRTTLPEDHFHVVEYRAYDDMKFSYHGIDYYFYYAEYGAYRTDLYFWYRFEGSSLTGEETDYWEVELLLENNWHKLANELVLTVDGTQYTVDENNPGYTWCDTEGELGEKNRCSVCPTFPFIDYANAESITLSFGEVSYTLK